MKRRPKLIRHTPTSSIIRKPLKGCNVEYLKEVIDINEKEPDSDEEENS